MRLTELVEVIDDGRQRCQVCQWRCALALGEQGHCLMRTRSEAGIEVVNDGLISAATVGPVDAHRLWHFFPNTQVLSIGSWGYAFPSDQQRGQYALPPEDESKRRRLDPERASTVAMQQLCRGVLWTYSDPTISHEYVLDLLRLARANSRYTALITSGYMTIEALDQIGHYLDGMCLELRAFDDAAYWRLTGVKHWRGILEVAVHAQQRWNCHIEVMTRLHPNVNDSAEQIQALAGWIRDALGNHVPWHVLPGDAGAAAAATVARVRRLGHEAGLNFVYGPEPNQSTVCSSCGTIVIDRSASGTRVVGLEDGRCASCGIDLHIRTSIFKR